MEEQKETALDKSQYLTSPTLQNAGVEQMEASALIRELLENKHVPKELLKNLWVLFGKSSKLTFLTPADIRRVMIEFEMLKIDIIESIPKSQYNEELEKQLRQIKMEFFFNIKRSAGSRMNERELLAATTQAVFAEQSLGSRSGDSRSGFLSRFYDAVTGK